ncbi:hypothetical protein MAM1_0038c02783 [Mucor ambiguus]|uniref:Uncharacterized protein n=1 Tax=Mucor ambiguus TaxID=91626 RepID=A0A0C9LT31_9FUNG|nr:hypothetical protein MAM1_0038c02783 [Mucor ambiguus]
MVRPFMKGVEEDSVFIDLTTVKARSLLDKALVQFNKEAETTDMYEEFLGYRKQTRQYLGHHFLMLKSARLLLSKMESLWRMGPTSFSENANIIRITMEKLPFLPAVQLKKQEMAERFSCFGDVLRHGIFKTKNEVFQGEG